MKQTMKKSSSTTFSQISGSKFSAGFTLIELLIVIAIISILASVIIPNVTSARDKGTVAAQRAEVKTVQTEAIVWAEANSGDLSLVCSTSTSPVRLALINALKKVNPSATSIATAAGFTATATTGVCHQLADSYGAEVPLKTGGYICVDSTGLVVESPTTRIAGGNDRSCL